MKQHIRDEVAGELTFEYFLRRMSEGWSLTSIEWVREAEGADIGESPLPFSANDPELVPFD